MLQLLKNFYSVRFLEVKEGVLTAQISLNKDHEIYQGHFPEVPVVPGVCQMQMLREILSETLGKKLSLVQADNMKFLAVIQPDKTNTLHVKIEFRHLEDQKIKVKGSLFFGEVIFFKFSGVLQEQENLK